MESLDTAEARGERDGVVRLVYVVCPPSPHPVLGVRVGVTREDREGEGEGEKGGEEEGEALEEVEVRGEGVEKNGGEAEKNEVGE